MLKPLPSEDKLPDYFNATFDSIIILNSDGIIEDLNNAALALLGSEKDDLLGRNLIDFFVETHNLEEDICEHVDLSTMIKRGLVKSMPLALTSVSNHETSVILSASIFKDQYDETGIICVIKDVTDQTLAKEQAELESQENAIKIRHLYDLQAGVLGSIQDSLFVMDEHGKVVQSNPKARQMLDISEHDLMGKNFQDLFETPDTKLYNIFDLFKASQNKEIVDLEIILKTPELATKVRLTASVISDNNGVVLLARDESDSNLVKELLANQQQLIETAKSASLGELSGGIAHEVNNPLAVISGYTELISELLENETELHQRLPKLKKHFSTIKDSAERVASIINHVQDFCQMSPHHMTNYQLNTVVQKAFDLLQQQLFNRKIEVELDLVEPSPLVQCDPNRLEQVFINIISNARDSLTEKFERNGGELKVTSQIIGGKVEISFQDNGMGVSSEQLSKVFNPFYTTKDVGSGSGLGLSIALGIIKDHSGEIEMEQNEHEGVTVKIQLNLGEEEETDN